MLHWSRIIYVFTVWLCFPAGLGGPPCWKIHTPRSFSLHCPEQEVLMPSDDLYETYWPRVDYILQNTIGHQRAFFNQSGIHYPSAARSFQCVHNDQVFNLKLSSHSGISLNNRCGIVYTSNGITNRYNRSSSCISQGCPINIISQNSDDYVYAYVYYVDKNSVKVLHNGRPLQSGKRFLQRQKMTVTIQAVEGANFIFGYQVFSRNSRPRPPSQWNPSDCLRSRSTSFFPQECDSKFLSSTTAPPAISNAPITRYSLTSPATDPVSSSSQDSNTNRSAVIGSIIFIALLIICVMIIAFIIVNRKRLNDPCPWKKRTTYPALEQQSTHRPLHEHTNVYGSHPVSSPARNQNEPLPLPPAYNAPSLPPPDYNAPSLPPPDYNAPSPPPPPYNPPSPPPPARIEPSAPPLPSRDYGA